MDCLDGHRAWSRRARQRSTGSFPRRTLDCGMRLQQPARVHERRSQSRCPYRVDQQPFAHARGLVHRSKQPHTAGLTADLLLDDRLLLHGAQAIRGRQVAISQKSTTATSAPMRAHLRSAFERRPPSMTSEDSRASSTGAATLKTLLLRQTAQDLGGISKRSYRLSKRNQIAPVGTMSLFDRSCHLRAGL